MKTGFPKFDHGPGTQEQNTLVILTPMLNTLKVRETETILYFVELKRSFIFDVELKNGISTLQMGPFWISLTLRLLLRVC